MPPNGATGRPSSHAPPQTRQEHQPSAALEDDDLLQLHEGMCSWYWSVAADK